MKKVFTLFLALFTFVAVQAQTLLSEDFESGIPTTWTNTDSDGDGYTWLPSVDETGISGHNGTSGCAYSQSYTSTAGALTPDNWLITPAVTLTANSDLTFWICAQDASWAAEHYGVYISTTGTSTSSFTLLMEETIDANGGAKVQGTWKQKTISLANYTGQTVYIAFRHFNCTDMFYINLDDVEITAQPTDPTISVVPATINFGNTVIGASKTSSAVVSCYNLTTDVTAMTTAPFEVSADGSTYGTSASIAAAGGTLYVKYTPTAVGTDNGTVTLSSTGATSVTMTLSGTGMDCNASIPYSCNFTDAAQNTCWDIIDANADGNTFIIDEEEGYIYYSYDMSTPADEWALSPVFTMTSGLLLSLDYYVYSSSYPEAFQVFAIGADTVALTSVMTVNNTAAQTLFVDLGNLTGTYQIAIHCVSDANMWNLYFTNFSIANNTPNLLVSEESIDFGTVEMGNTSAEQMVTATALNLTDAVVVSVAAPFEISADGATYGASLTFPASTSMAVYDTFYVRFAPTAAGTFSQTLTVTAGTFSQTIALTGESVDCTPGITLPYTNNFDNGIVPPICWSYGLDAANFTAMGMFVEGDYGLAIVAEDYIITPEIQSTDAIKVSFDIINYFGTSAETPTYFRVGYSTTDNNASSFTWQGDNLCAADEPVPFFTFVPAGTKYVAVGVSQLGSGLFWGMFEMEDEFVIDNFTLTAQTDAMLTISPESMSFGSINFGAPAPVRTATVVGALLTNNIDITAPANFEVSANGTSYASTATLPQDGGMLYVRYNPSAPGYHTGDITFTSGSITKTLPVFGSAIDCSSADNLPFGENFDVAMPPCWTILDADGDGYSWEYSAEPFSYFPEGTDLSGSGNNGSNGYLLSGSYSNVYGVLYPDNWLITPALNIPSQGAKLSFYVAAQDANYANEHYGVYVSTSGITPSDFTLLYEEDLDADGGPRAQGTWKEKQVNLPYGGQTIHLAIRHFNCSDMFILNFDDINVTPGTGVEDHGLKTVIFPNPANNMLNINASANINRVEVYNMMGQMVGSYNVNDMNTQINTTALANGVYTVKISTENGMSTKKFTVAR